MTGNIAVAGEGQNTLIAFKNCSPFIRCFTHLNDEHVERADNLDIIMNMYNLTEYSDNYADSSGSLWQYKRDEQNMTAAGNPDNVTENDSSSFKYKPDLLKGLTSTDVAANTDPDTAAVHRYLSNFSRSLEMPLVNCKIHLELNWTKNSIMSSVSGVSTFQITSTKLYVPIVTLPTKENVKLTKQLEKGFKRSVYWIEYETKRETQEADANKFKKFSLDASFQGDNRLFVLAFNNVDNDANKVERDSHKKYFLPRVNITKYNVLIDGRIFYDQPINDETKQYDEIRRIATGKEDDLQQGVC